MEGWHIRSKGGTGPDGVWGYTATAAVGMLTLMSQVGVKNGKPKVIYSINFQFIIKFFPCLQAWIPDLFFTIGLRFFLICMGKRKYPCTFIFPDIQLPLLRKLLIVYADHFHVFRNHCADVFCTQRA
jgi:hypothetical protein